MSTREVMIDQESIRMRVSHRIPLTLDEQRWLAEVAIGGVQDQRRRCDACDGSGRSKLVATKSPCWHCGGLGYVANDIVYWVE